MKALVPNMLNIDYPIKAKLVKLSFHPFLLQDQGLCCGLCQHIGVLLEWRFAEASLLPEFRCQETIGLHQTVKCSLQK